MTAPCPRDLPRPLLLSGLAGSLLLALGGLGRGALPRPRPGDWFGIAWPLDSGAGRLVALALVVAGGVLLVGAWWRARAVLDDVAPRALLRATGLWSAPLLVGPPLFSRDVYAYGAQAVIALRGFDPYSLGPIEGGGWFSAHVDDVWRGTPSPYGPAFLGPAALLARAAGTSVETSVLLLRLLAVLGLVLTAWALPRLAARCDVPAQRALWLGLANPLALVHGVSGAHNDALMIGLMVAGLAVGLAALDRRRHRAASDLPTGGGRARAAAARGAALLVAAGALIATGALVKAVALAALPVLVLAAAGWRARARAAALLSAGAGAVALAVPAATGLGWGWIGTLDTGRVLLSLYSPATGLASAVGAAGRLLGVTDGTAAARDPLLDAAAAVCVLAAGALVLLTPRLGPVRALGLALLALVLLSPTVLPWYLLWGVVPLAAASGRRLADALGALCVVVCFATWPDGRSLVREPYYGAQLAVGLLLAALTWRRDREGHRRPAANSKG